jgi:hypothetical protein
MLWLAVQRMAVLLEERSSITGVLQKGHLSTAPGTVRPVVGSSVYRGLSGSTNMNSDLHQC